MAEEVKQTLCTICSQHCPVTARLRDGKSVAQEYGGGVKGCGRAAVAAEYVYHPLRLNYPLKRIGDRGANKWQRVSWEQALDEIAQRLKEIRAKYGPESLVM